MENVKDVINHVIIVMVDNQTIAYHAMVTKYYLKEDV